MNTDLFKNIKKDCEHYVPNAPQTGNHCYKTFPNSRCCYPLCKYKLKQIFNKGVNQ